MKIGRCYALKSYINFSQLHCFLSLGMQITTQGMSVAKIQHSSRPFNVSLHTPISVTTKYCVYSVHTWTLEFNTISNVQVFRQFNKEPSQIAKFIGSTWGPPGSCWPQMGHMLVPWTLPVPSEFPAQRPVTRSFDVFFDLRRNKRLSKQSWGWWFETLLRPLWRHRNETSNCSGSAGASVVAHSVALPLIEIAFSTLDCSIVPTCGAWGSATAAKRGPLKQSWAGIQHSRDDEPLGVLMQMWNVWVNGFFFFLL